jgi:hypothetical protein
MGKNCSFGFIDTPKEEQEAHLSPPIVSFLDYAILAWHFVKN